MNLRFQVAENFAELFVDNNYVTPPALDKQICSISLRAMTNDPTGEFGLCLDAHFGRERIILDADGDEAEFLFEIYKVEIAIDTAHCYFKEYFTDEERLDGVRKGEVWSAAQELETKVVVDTGGILEVLTGGGRIALERSKKNSATEHPESWYEISLLSRNLISIEAKGESPKPLTGKLISNFIGWQVVPAGDRPSGVVATARVREGWIMLSDPTEGKTKASLWARSIALLKSSDPKLEERKAAFQKLLNHLVALGLQTDDERRKAILDVDAVIVRPLDDAIESRPSKALPGSLEVEGKTVADFDKVPLGQEQRFLTLHGITEDPLEFRALDKEKMQERLFQLEAVEFSINNIRPISVDTESDKNQIGNFIFSIISGELVEPNEISRFSEVGGYNLSRLCDAEVLLYKYDFGYFASQFYSRLKGGGYHPYSHFDSGVDEDIKKYRIRNYYCIPCGYLIVRNGLKKLVNEDREYYRSIIDKRIVVLK